MTNELVLMKNILPNFKYINSYNTSYIIIKSDNKNINITIHALIKYSYFYNQTFLVDTLIFFNLFYNKNNLIYIYKNLKKNIYTKVWVLNCKKISISNFYLNSI